MTRAPLILLVLAGCMVPRHVTDTLSKTEDTITKANAVYARMCAPEELARAQSSVDFTRLELAQGDVRRAGDHATVGYEAALAALEKATECGGADRDQDRVPDIVDRCPDEPEDHDGVDDTDGCRDLDPTGDEDRDGIVNIDDACIDIPEDLDGDRDEDGCPETSDDSDGDGLIDAVDPCPEDAEDFDGFQDQDGCPELDNDNDLVNDLRDGCPLVPEDTDGWEDEDGCPDPDNDSDGVADSIDRCPNEPGPTERQGCPDQDADDDGISDANDQCPTQPETKNGYLDDDGCPDEEPKKVVVTRTRVEIKETIEFQTGSATLLPSANSILDDVVKVLQDVPDMRLRIEGHTDNQGSDSANLQLSQERAFSVRVYLESRGIPRERLEAVGRGELEPIDTNRTPGGRQRNRRVEFHILRQGEPSAPTPAPAPMPAPMEPPVPMPMPAPVPDGGGSPG
ncbi:MAG: OmpA family protein [Alphaproteobacteria bacterium]|nr:OmpA family protein [Alphaproteobacteria bacterium]MCB9693210.1 OmpA family protein [Alphaproteobacteria bacterium]